jgi:hypothetical protein
MFVKINLETQHQHVMTVENNALVVIKNVEMLVIKNVITWNDIIC